jgi:hypothetical protein
MDSTILGWTWRILYTNNGEGRLARFVALTVAAAARH